MAFPPRYQHIADNLLAPQNAPPFTYSDGEVEEYIAETVAKASDCSVMSPEMAKAIKSWPTLYHFSYRRSFLLRPVRHLLHGKSVLELGAGCGALTRYLGETAGRVVALEGSPRRAGIAASRCRDLASVTVVNDTIQGLELSEKFDVVTLLGVLEYARSFGPETEKPEAALLAIARSFLKPDGHLLLAIENQLGLKYFAGAPEDHLGRPFFGIHDLYSATTPVTFGRKELLGLLEGAGFASVEQLVPLPDYKLPVTVLYPACFEGESPSPDVTPFIQNSYSVDMQKATDYSFSLEAATSAIVRNGLVRDLCNSLYFVASIPPGVQTCDADRYVAHYGTVRLPEYAKETVVLKEDGALRVQRRYLDPDLDRTENDVIIHVIEDEPYLPYPLYYDSLIPIINTPGWNRQTLAAWARDWVDFLRAKGVNGRLPGSFLDATPLNCAVAPGGEIILFDQEWQARDENTIPLWYAVFRGLYQSFSCFENVAPPADKTPTNVLDLIATVMGRLGILLGPEMMDDCIGLEMEFQMRATGTSRDVRAFRAQKLRVRLFA